MDMNMEFKCEGGQSIIYGILVTLFYWPAQQHNYRN